MLMIASLALVDWPFAARAGTFLMAPRFGAVVIWCRR